MSVFGVPILIFLAAFQSHHAGLMVAAFARPPGERWQRYQDGFIDVLSKSFAMVERRWGGVIRCQPMV